MIELELPWPDRALHPNARGHWAKRANAARTARSMGRFEMRRQNPNGFVMVATKYHLHLDFYPPDRRKRDDDGCLSSFKPYRDGIADALGIDDNRFVSHPRVMDEVVKGGLVRVRIVPEGL